MTIDDAYARRDYARREYKRLLGLYLERKALVRAGKFTPEEWGAWRKEHRPQLNRADAELRYLIADIRWHQRQGTARSTMKQLLRASAVLLKRLEAEGVDFDAPERALIVAAWWRAHKRRRTDRLVRPRPRKLRHPDDEGFGAQPPELVGECVDQNSIEAETPTAP